MAVNSASDKRDWFSVDDVVNSYVQWLEVKAPRHLKSFTERMTHDPQAGQAEAVVFSILHAKQKNPVPAEIIGAGGVDFHCRPNSEAEFVVEVTALHAEAVARKSGLTGRFDDSENNRVGSFAMITSSLLSEAIGKARQMANYPMPRVLFLVSSHGDASMLMGTRGAKELLTGTTSFSVPLGGSTDGIALSATLQNSVFMRLNSSGDGVEPARQSISAVILVGLTPHGCGLVGVLHPAPAHSFDPRTFSSVPFLKLIEWPITGNRFGVEWVGPEPDPTAMMHWPIALNDRELRRLD